ncbi:hypothetical protein MEO40_26385 [Dolichospermum sp. ST_sed1]|nr:hypothetical protein [Dolichospermum sp. ST_sed1]MDD1432963.1 hypothetical protein [Dolichospermum sp. ST_sed6]MDD1438121.1 hypothetical protein [Dolichospermum sp. ST_sed10]MDD1443202.1 hypothetical protein [Dolichospermum sp. ST_sed3]MDD1445761.1 hypothetical protein [Dolichospermum sp. ST_sed8]MDD1458208.1 hypothetical protein [Dolichospermum sp. ST_sed7]MDD1461009.1 hypothetical protein [Dolichospermum sp. ST_sed2]MDD1463797.1 hypothetical protein [Dolichospermum sp. ST_sed5]MDD14698
MTSSKFQFPVVGLIISIGVLGINYSSQQHYKLLSSSALAANYVVPHHQSHINSNPALLSRVQEIKQESIQQSPVNSYYQVSTDKLTENITTLSTNTRELDRKRNVQFPEQDGIYLYGQSATPNQLGQGYVLFQKQQSKIIGALYVPQSEFSCFQGTLAESGELALTVKSSPGEVGAIEVSTSSTIPKISDDESTTYAHSVTLQDYHQLNSLSANDREMLQMCKRDANGVR